MLLGVLEDYVASLPSEKALYTPFLTLLPAMGLQDVHFTHGMAEFGKDFIAKDSENGSPLQCTFQCKSGDINQAAWRDGIQGQMIEALTSTLSHPAFDRNLPHQVYLVTTGRLIGNAPIAVQEFNASVPLKIGARPIIVWERPQLVDLFARFGLEGVRRSTAADVQEYGGFYNLYGDGMRDRLSLQGGEQHSRHWLRDGQDGADWLLVGVLEAEILAAQAVGNSRSYDAIRCHLSILRTVLHDMWDQSDADRLRYLLEVHEQVVITLLEECRRLYADTQAKWEEAEHDLLKLIHGGVSNIIGYPIQCARVLEVTGLLYFLEGPQRRTAVADFLREFSDQEAGCAHIISDKYAVSLVPPVLALIHAGHLDEARKLICKSTVWLCDRYQAGIGLARFDASPKEETETLLGYPFESVDIESRNQSFLAAVLCDLAAFLGDATFYANVVNDIKASRIYPQYWQPADTRGQFRIEAEDIIQYPSINYEDQASPFTDFAYAEHIVAEYTAFQVTEKVSVASYLGLSVYLRDRYFPTLWPRLVPAG